MKVIRSLLLLVVGVSAGASAATSDDSNPALTLAECKTFCSETRTSILGDINPCKAALKHGSTPKLFNACVEGRKKSFDQSCVAVCTNAERSVSSFEACKIISRTKDAKHVSWCRKGYDSISQTLKGLLGEHTEKLKQRSEEEGVAGEPEVLGESTKEEPTKEAIREPEASDLHGEDLSQREQAPTEPTQSVEVADETYSEPALTEQPANEPEETQSVDSKNEQPEQLANEPENETSEESLLEETGADVGSKNEQHLRASKANVEGAQKEDIFQQTLGEEEPAGTELEHAEAKEDEETQASEL